MALNRISASDFAQMIIDGIASRDVSLDTQIGPIRDLQIDPVSEVLEQQNNRVVYLSQLNSMKYADRAVPDDLDDVVFNEGVVRWSGSRSIATVTFSRASAPTSDIIVPLNFPLSTPVDPGTGASIVFRTIETKTMFASAPTSYFNATTGKYELDVLVASITVGASTAVGPHTITVFRRPIPGFDEVFNVEKTSSGKGLETNLDLADRYLLHVAGSKPGVPAGIKRSVLDNFSSVSDAYVVYGQNAAMTREQSDAGAVDIWVLGEQPAAKRYVVAYPGVETLIPLDRQPLMTVTAVRDSFGTLYVQDTDYVIVTDTGEWSNSVLAQDGIKFLTTAATLPANLQDPLTIDYSYNSLINILASYYTQPEEYTMGQNQLFRWAQQVDILIEANLKVRSGNPSDVANAVRTSIKNYINSLKLGDAVEEFDIDAVVSQVYGVDNFVYNTLAVSTGTGVGDIAIGPNEYARIADPDLIINLV
jgi:uncharacterized phage protein gp47/JayE